MIRRFPAILLRFTGWSPDAPRIFTAHFLLERAIAQILSRIEERSMPVVRDAAAGPFCLSAKARTNAGQLSPGLVNP